MDAYEAILSRRSVPRMTNEKPPRREIASLLDAAVAAPNHHLTQPWRFIVLTGDALDALGEAMAMRVRREAGGDPQAESRAQAERSKPHRAPVIVVVVYVRSSHPKAVEVEDRYSVGAAMQNILLAAHARGMGSFLRTGPAAFDPGVARALGLEEGEELAGFVYLGYPASEPSQRPPRAPAAERTEWRGWD